MRRDGEAEEGSNAHAYAACMPRGNNSYDFNRLGGATPHEIEFYGTFRSISDARVRAIMKIVAEDRVLFEMLSL